MGTVVITANSPHTSVSVVADEYLIVAQGAWIADSQYAIFRADSGRSAGEIDIEGSLTADDGIYFAYGTGDETISVGATGTVTGSVYGVFFNEQQSGAQFMQNAGYIHGGFQGVDMNGSSAVLQNTGTIDGGVGVEMIGSSDLFENAVSGTVSGQTAVLMTAALATVLNQGSLSGSATVNGVVHLGGIGSTVDNGGEIQGLGNVVDFTAADASLQNSGKIVAAQDDAISERGDGAFIENSGEISASFNTIVLDGVTSGADWVVNDVGGIIRSQTDSYAIFIYLDTAHIVNHGDIFGAVDATAANAILTNTGDWSGHVYLASSVVVRNAGQMSYDDNGDDITITGATGADDRLVNTANAVIGGAGGVAINHGAVGTFRIVNHGDIYGDIDGGQTSLTNAGFIGGNVSFAAGASLLVNRGELDGSLTFTGVGNIYRGLAGEVTGTIYGAGVNGRYLGGAADDTFDMTDSGAQYVSGGAGDDTFLFTAVGLNAATRVLGGDGMDTLTFTTPGTIAPSAFAHVSSIETINLGGGNNNITLSNALVNSASGGALTVNGGNFVDTINASGVTNAADTVTMYGGLGADAMTAGGATDIFAYHAASESTGPTYDTITGANLSIDKFDVSAPAKSILAINTAVTTGSLSTATFNADLTTALPAAKLGAHDAVLFTPNAGTLSGQTFLVIDVNGTAGYQASADLVIRLAGATGTLTTGSFV